MNEPTPRELQILIKSLDDRIDQRFLSLEKMILVRNLDTDNRFDRLISIVEKLVTNERFHPVQVIVYGMVGMIITSVLTAILARVILR